MATILASLALAVSLAMGQDERFEPLDVFQLEYASDPQIHGERVVYVRNFMDIMKDRRRSNLWIVGTNGEGHRPLTTGLVNDASPRWSPDGGRLAYVSSSDGSSQIWMRWMDTGQTARITHLTESPSGLAWSPDGKSIAFSMHVPEESEPLAKLPAAPEGAEWAEKAKVIDKLLYRSDGSGYLAGGHDQVFVVSAEGGTARQLTRGSFHHGGAPTWLADSSALLIAANRRADAELEPLDSEIFRVSLSDGELTQITDRRGPDHSPVIVQNGRIAYLGFKDEYQGYQIDRIYTELTADAAPFGPARNVDQLLFAAGDQSIYVRFDDLGSTKIGSIDSDREFQVVTASVGGASIGRPYTSGSFSVSDDGTCAFTYSRPDRPADVAVQSRGTDVRVLTALNEDLLAHKELGAIEEIWFESSHDGRRIQGWIVTPPAFDPSNKYPLILEIHGGPFAGYGPHFAAELQLYAAAGYVVLYANPRGSSGYGEEFGNLIHHAYPGHDYDDLMSGVDAVIARGFVDEGQLYVTGGSGGGVLTSWIVGKTDRFRAAVVAKPVINWYSFVLTADAYPFFYKYWFPGFPWDHAEHYLARSPISLVGNVTTPTMLLTGEEDYRTPMSESEQYYQALKLRQVDTALVRIPGAGHGITARPSHLIAKVAHILAWFEKHRGP